MGLPDIEAYIEQKLPTAPVESDPLAALPRPVRKPVEGEDGAQASASAISKEARAQRAADEARRGGGRGRSGPGGRSGGGRSEGGRGAGGRGPRRPRREAAAAANAAPAADATPRPERAPRPRTEAIATDAVPGTGEGDAARPPRKRRRRRGGRKLADGETAPADQQA